MSSGTSWDMVFSSSSQPSGESSVPLGFTYEGSGTLDLRTPCDGCSWDLYTENVLWFLTGKPMTTVVTCEGGEVRHLNDLRVCTRGPWVPGRVDSGW